MSGGEGTRKSEAITVAVEKRAIEERRKNREDNLVAGTHIPLGGGRKRVQRGKRVVERRNGPKGIILP